MRQKFPFGTASLRTSAVKLYQINHVVIPCDMGAAKPLCTTYRLRDAEFLRMLDLLLL